MKFGRIIMKQSKEEEEQPEFESRLHLCGYHVQSEEKVQLEVSKCERLNLELKIAQQESCDLYQQLQVRSLVHVPGHILLYILLTYGCGLGTVIMDMGPVISDGFCWLAKVWVCMMGWSRKWTANWVSSFFLLFFSRSWHMRRCCLHLQYVKKNKGFCS